jgi:hypothetical protein
MINIHWYCDSGANIQSRIEGVNSVSELGCTDQEWNAMTEDEKEPFVREWAFDRLDWGWTEKVVGDD